MPPTQKLKDIYAIIVGVPLVPQTHVGPIYSTPELALIVGNLYTYIVSPKHKVALKLRRKSTIAANSVDFVFKPSHRLAFEPGQYMDGVYACAPSSGQQGQSPLQKVTLQRIPHAIAALSAA